MIRILTFCILIQHSHAKLPSSPFTAGSTCVCPKRVGSFGYSTDFPLRKTVRSDNDSIILMPRNIKIEWLRSVRESTYMRSSPGSRRRSASRYLPRTRTLRCCRWACGCILIVVSHVQVGVNIRENGVWPSLYDVAVSWLRLQTPFDCIPHPYWMYTQCLSVLRCCEWAYGYTLMLYYMCR